MGILRALFGSINAGNLAGVQSAITAGVDVNAHDDEGETPLHRAASVGNSDVVRALLAAGAGPGNGNPSLGNATPLDRAAYHGHAAVVRTLLEAGASPRHAGNDGRTALHEASSAMLRDVPGHVECVRVLLEKGADLNAQSNSGATPLHSASLSAEGAPVVQVLLEAGADARHADNDGQTALHHAGAIGNPDSVRLLLDAGADPNVKTPEGWTVLDGVVGLAFSFKDDPNELSRYEKTYQLIEARGGEESGIMRSGAGRSGCLGGLIVGLALLVVVVAIV